MPGTLAEIPPTVIGGSIISTVSLILHIIGFSTTYWYIMKNTVGDTIGHIGLWKECGPAEEGLGDICMDLTGSLISIAQFKAADALECLALVALIAAVVCAFLKVFLFKEHRKLFVATGLLNMMAGIIALIGVIVFATYSNNDFKFDSSNFHYSFGLCIVGGIGGILSGIVFILVWRWVRN